MQEVLMKVRSRKVVETCTRLQRGKDLLFVSDYEVEPLARTLSP